MRRVIVSTFVLSCLPLAVSTQASAQNYIAPHNYDGAGVIVNMDVLNTPSTRMAPVVTQNLAPPAFVPAPIRLHPPRPVAVTPMAPSYSAPAPIPAPIRPAPVASMPAPAPKIAPAPVIAPALTSPIAVQPPATELKPAKPYVSPALQDLILDKPATSNAGTPPVPVALPPVNVPSIAAPRKTVPAINSSAPATPRRQALGSLHDEALPELPSPQALPPIAPKLPPAPPVDEMTPDLPPALSSPVTGNPSPVQTKPTTERAVTPIAPKTVSGNDNFEAYRLFFDPSNDTLKAAETAVLDKVIAKLSSDPLLHLQVRAYANGTGDNEGAARRLSLSRALKVRDYLIGKNIASTRLDIRALGSGSAEMGDKAGSGTAPPDRVDLVFSK